MSYTSFHENRAGLQLQLRDLTYLKSTHSRTRSGGTDGIWLPAALERQCFLASTALLSQSQDLLRYMIKKISDVKRQTDRWSTYDRLVMYSYFIDPSAVMMMMCDFRLWPEVVRTRIRDTYAYFGGSLVFTAASAVAISRSPRMMNLMMRSSWVVSLRLSLLTMTHFVWSLYFKFNF